MPTPLQRLNRRRQKKSQQISGLLVSQEGTQPDVEQHQQNISPKLSLHSSTRVSQTSSSGSSGYQSVSNESKKVDGLWSSSLYQKSSYKNSGLGSNNGESTISFGEKRIYFHSSTFSDSILYLNPLYFNGINQGDVISLTYKKDRPPVFLEVGCSPEIDSNIAISIQEKIGRYLKITPHQLVHVDLVSRQSTALSVIEVNIVDGCLPRHETWSLLRSLHDHFVYVNQRLHFDECDVEVSNLTKDGKKMLGGLITSSTSVVFCRSNCRMYVVVHISREILCDDNSGYLRGEIVTDYCMKKIQELWKQGNTHHTLTVLLYMHLDLYHQGHVTRFGIPFIRILCKDFQGGLEEVQCEIRHTISTIGSDFTVPIHSSELQLSEDDIFKLSRSDYSSPLTALNTILKDIKYNKQTASFSVNGSHVVFITASVPTYCVDDTYYYITQDSFHEAAVGVDIVSVAPVSPFKAPLIQFTNHTSSSVVAGFMPAIFYSVEANAFVRSVDKRDYGHSFQRMISHLHSFYGQTSLFKRRFANLPKVLPKLPYGIQDPYQQSTTNLQEILSVDEAENCLSPSLSTDSHDPFLPRSPDDQRLNQRNSGLAANFSSYDSTYGSLEKYPHELDSGLTSSVVYKGGSPPTLDHNYSRQASMPFVLFSPSDYSLVSNTSNYYRDEEMDAQQDCINQSNMFNDDILFWSGKSDDNHYTLQFIRSMIRPASFPLLPANVEIEDPGNYKRSTYNLLRSHFRDYILVRLKYNFQFEKSIPFIDNLESVVLHQHRKERHILTLSASSVTFQTAKREGPKLESTSLDVLIQYPSTRVPVLKRINVEQPSIDWNKIDFTLDPKEVPISELRTMKHYNRLHYAVCGGKNHSTELDSFLSFLEKRFPLFKRNGVQLSSLSQMTPIELSNETLLLVYDNTVTSPLCFRFDVYWCVASLKTVRYFVNEIKRNASKSNLHFLSYPDELACSFYQSISPFFYWYEISYNDCNYDSLLLLISNHFHILNELEGRYIGFTDSEMSSFAQIDKQDRVIRLTKNTHLYGDHCMKCILLELIGLSNYVDELLSAVKWIVFYQTQLYTSNTDS